jgi:hypothetical protein
MSGQILSKSMDSIEFGPCSFPFSKLLLSVQIPKLNYKLNVTFSKYIVDDMGTRIDELEKSIGALAAEATTAEEENALKVKAAANATTTTNTNSST